MKILFCQFAIALIVMLVFAVMIPLVLEMLAINMGLATKANQSELLVKEMISTLKSAPDITKVVIPRGCGYLFLDSDLNEISSNMSSAEKEDALLYVKGEYREYGTDRKFELVVREQEICVLRYYVGTQFTISWLPKHFPSPDILTVMWMMLNSLLVIIILTARFAKNLRLQLNPLFEATSQVAKQNLDFEMEHSEIKEFEDVLLAFSEMKDNLKESLEQQWKTEQMQKEQIAALAHDLKTPLTVIQGNADLINETDFDEEQRLYANYIIESSEQMQLYIKTLIEISRAAVGYQLHMERVDFGEYIERIEKQIKSLCQAKGIHLQMKILSALKHLKIDKMLLERGIMNVVNNALEYSPQGGNVSIEMSREDGYFQISIADEGTGFSKEALQHAREQFFMEDQSRSSKMHFGMGLYITDSIMKQHGGEMILRNSEKQGGAEVILRI